jgi:hypothetical protein
LSGVNFLLTGIQGEKHLHDPKEKGNRLLGVKHRYPPEVFPSSTEVKVVKRKYLNILSSPLSFIFTYANFS